MRVMVLGGGVIGTTTAYFLARAGHQVSVIDRAPLLAAECSHANGGMLHASHTEPWNSPAILGQLFKWIGRRRSPLLVHLDQLPNLAGWGLGFLRYSRPRDHKRNTLVNTRLALYSQAQMQALAGELEIDYDQADRGIMKIFRQQKTFADAKRGSELVARSGVAYRILDAAGVVELEPALAEVQSELIGGIYYPGDSSGDARLFTRGLGEHLGKLGVDFHMDTTVKSIEGDSRAVRNIITDKGEFQADCYVLATGVDAPKLVRKLGIKLPIRPVKGYSATLPLDGISSAPDIPLIDEARKVVITKLGNHLRLAGIAEFAGFDRSIDSERGRLVVEQGLANFPSLSAAMDSAKASLWSCLRPLTVDGPPILGKSPVPNLFLNTGSGHLGWTLAAGAARVVADLVSDKTPEIALDGLGYDRYFR